MCNLSEVIKEDALKRGFKEGIEKGIEKERIAAIERMIYMGVSKEQIISYGYTENEYAKAADHKYTLH